MFSDFHSPTLKPYRNQARRIFWLAFTCVYCHVWMVRHFPHRRNSRHSLSFLGRAKKYPMAVHAVCNFSPGLFNHEKCHLHIRSKKTLNHPVEIMLNNDSNRPCADCFNFFILLNLRRGTNVLKCFETTITMNTSILLNKKSNIPHFSMYKCKTSSLFKLS